jgi:aspartate/methionine/tyrosine aminotransferase
MNEIAARRGVALIVDEVFFDFAWGQDEGRVSSLAVPHEALVFTLSGLSKAAGLPQMKLGWVHVGGPETLVRGALARLEWIADAYLPVSAPVQHAVPKWLELAVEIRRRILERVLGNRGMLPFEAHSEGGWCSVLNMPNTMSGESWALELLARQGVLVQPGFFYDFGREAVLVASLLTEPVELERAARLVTELSREMA